MNMKRVILLLLAMVLAVMPALQITAEEMEMEFVKTPDEIVIDRSDKTDEENTLEDVKDVSESLLEMLGKKEWTELAESVRKTGDWREDIVSVAKTQVGYTQAEDGMTFYTVWAELKEPQPWTALFISWVAMQTGIPEEVFPRLETYDAFIQHMTDIRAYKQITRSNYPVPGDLALIRKDIIQENGEKLPVMHIGVVAYVSNGLASVVLGDDLGAVTTDLYVVDDYEFTHYIDLNVLMERMGINVGKGGRVPEIPEEGLAAWTNTNAVYMRAEPTTASARVTTVKKKGTALIVVSGKKEGDGYIWYGVEYGQYKGYIRGDLLELDLSAVKAEPTATVAPTVQPGCAVCLQAAGGVALPQDCCYAQLAAMDAAELARFLASLKENDQLTYKLYVDCHQAHADHGDAVLLAGDDAAQDDLAQKAPSAEEEGGLSLQQRAVNIVVNQPVHADGTMPGQAVTFTFEVYGAAGYQWFRAETGLAEEGVITLLEGETGTTLTVIAGEGNAAASYYCEATLLVNGAETVVTSKLAGLNVAELIEAQAIIGEDVTFTYNVEGAAAYQWYVLAEDAYVPVENAAASSMMMQADLSLSGAKYYCEALDADGAQIARSACYTYVIPMYDTYDTDGCTGHDLCKYVAELANMTRAERHEIMTTLWNIPVGETTLAALVRQHWLAQHQDVYATLLCTCDALQPEGAKHEASCPWAEKKQPAKTERQDADPCEAHKGHMGSVICAYEALRALETPMARYAFLQEKQAEDQQYGTDVYAHLLEAHAAHVQRGDAALVCICQSMQLPGMAHDQNCPWLQADAAGSLMLTHTGLREGESAILTVSATPVGVDAPVVYTIVLTGPEAAAVIGDLAAGTAYTVEEMSAWHSCGSAVNLNSDSAWTIAADETVYCTIGGAAQHKWLQDESSMTVKGGEQQ